jgi:hypothetical protein
LTREEPAQSEPKGGIGVMVMKRLITSLLMSFLFCSVRISYAAEPKPGWQQEWEKTVEAAKKEGRLNLYVGRYGTEVFLNEFRKEYPAIKLVTVNGTGNDLGTRILAEARAGKVLADLFSGGANTNYNLLYKGKVLDSIKDALILPEVVDESKWYEGQHSYGDPEGKHIYIYIANPTSSSLYFNTTLASPNEFTSHWDLLKPKWQGKFVSQRSREHRTRRDNDILLLQSGVRAGIHQAAVWHHECHLWKRPKTDYRLARAREIRHLPWLQGRAKSKESRSSGG